MKTEFRRALSTEIRALAAFDRKIFRESDRFDTAYWKAVEAYWMLVNNVKVGCCAFEKHVDFQEDIGDDPTNFRMDGSLYISTTGILPAHQGKGLGQLLKCWEIAYARLHGFTRIITNSRKGNHAMIALNRKFGFEIIRTTPHYYSDPTDSAVVMELVLSPRSPCKPSTE
jgi:ribosomal protein S18 acetylase RimI-like enzyme